MSINVTRKIQKVWIRIAAKCVISITYEIQNVWMDSIILNRNKLQDVFKKFECLYLVFNFKEIRSKNIFIVHDLIQIIWMFAELNTMNFIYKGFNSK